MEASRQVETGQDASACHFLQEVIHVAQAVAVAARHRVELAEVNTKADLVPLHHQHGITCPRAIRRLYLISLARLLNVLHNELSLFLSPPACLIRHRQRIASVNLNLKVA